ncbi:PIR Superfamily Protein [Plasmodium ovale curtisi]|uniref:PIR Superfamily Protein n=1 Tax=Plasmodium ovale curtisi TaxID=864141 RepID=A0A1A8XDE7_PLAOA|nr:PIR Superfamily Protein [Plasmodium ovale curtisi]
MELRQELLQQCNGEPEIKEGCSNPQPALDNQAPCDQTKQAGQLNGIGKENLNAVSEVSVRNPNDGNTPAAVRYPQGILRRNGIYIPISIEDTPYILQNEILRIVYMIILTLTIIYVIFHYSKRSPVDYSFIKKIFKRKKGKSTIRRKHKNEVTVHDSEDIHIISYNRPLHLGYYQS